MASPDLKNSFKLVVVSPDEILFEDEATRLLAPGVIQEIAILPNHTPLYSELQQGNLQITKSDGQKQSIPLESGIIRVKSNRVSIITGF